MGPCCAPSAGDRSVAAAGPVRWSVNTGDLEPAAGDVVAMVRLSGGRFLMGSEDADVNPCDGEGPLREVSLSPYWIGRCAVTNAEFAQFVNSTGYRTGAERFGWSFVFASFLPPALRRGALRPDATPWWCRVSGAY